MLDEFRGVEEGTKLSRVILEPIGADIGKGQPARLRLAFSVIGGLRDVFTPDVWELAYRSNDMMLALRYAISVYRKGVGRRRVLGPLKMQKEARLYWTRNPMRAERIWVIAVDEDENVYRPASVEDAKQLLFDFEREIVVPREELSMGENRLWAEVNLWWTRHVYSEKGERRARSRETSVRVV